MSKEDYLVRCGYCGKIVPHSESHGDYFVGWKCRDCHEKQLMQQKNFQELDKRVRDVLDHEIMPRLNALLMTFACGNISTTRGWAISLRKAFQELADILEQQMHIIGCDYQECIFCEQNDNTCKAYFRVRDGDADQGA
ncbi:hypothetical protein [Geoglobus ahangari]